MGRRRAPTSERAARGVQRRLELHERVHLRAARGRRLRGGGGGGGEEQEREVEEQPGERAPGRHGGAGTDTVAVALVGVCVWRRGNPEVYRGFTVKSGGVKSWEARKAFGWIVKKVEKGL